MIQNKNNKTMNKTVTFALVFNSAKIEEKEIEALFTDVRSAEKYDVDYINGKVFDILDHYFIVTYNQLL